jgi:hypothetical protein
MVIGLNTTYTFSAYHNYNCEFVPDWGDVSDLLQVCCFLTDHLDKTEILLKCKGYGVLCNFQQYFSHIVAVSFIGRGNRSTRRKPPTCHKSLTNFIT